MEEVPVITVTKQVTPTAMVLFNVHQTIINVPNLNLLNHLLMQVLVVTPPPQYAVNKFTTIILLPVTEAKLPTFLIRQAIQIARELFFVQQKIVSAKPNQRLPHQLLHSP